MSEIKNRKEIDDKYKWKLEDMFSSDDEWEKLLAETRRDAQEFSKLRGSVADGEKTLEKALSELEKISDNILSLVSYACMRRDEDNSVSKYRAMADRAGDAESECSAMCAFFEPEIIAAGRENIFKLLGKSYVLSKYRHYFENIFRVSEHTLDETGERLLAMSAPMSESAGDIFSSLNNADLRFDDIKDESGKMTPLTHGRYGVFMESSDREVRKSAYDSMYAQYMKYGNTFAAMYAGNVKSDLFFARARGFDSAMEMHLSDGNIPCAVYDKLTEDVSEGIPALTEYLNLKKRILGLSEMKMYDIYAPVVPQNEDNIPFEEACGIVLEAVAPLGKEYTDDMKKAFEGRWIDVYENRGKTPGAYSWGDNRTHPFVLMNYQGKIEDVFTLAHEMGHAMHSYYTNRTQPGIYRNYKIFVAEVASTVNENLLMEHLMKNASGERLSYLLGRELEAIRTTFYRQTMFAEFERSAHEAYAGGTALTAEKLCSIYGDLNRKYYGGAVDCDEKISYEWARIPHFYTSFYVYQYATGFSAASRIKELVLKDSENAEKYLDFLKCGDSRYPIEALRDAGADLAESGPAKSVICNMRRDVSALSRIFEKQSADNSQKQNSPSKI